MSGNILQTGIMLLVFKDKPVPKELWHFESGLNMIIQVNGEIATYVASRTSIDLVEKNWKWATSMIFKTLAK